VHDAVPTESFLQEFVSKLIVLDGLDGCGKTTQYELTAENLAKKFSVNKISFPDYESNSSAAVKMYLGGEISDNAADINAYAASSFYAVDRYISYKSKWKKAYEAADITLAARYTTSNLIHQLPKMPSNERADFIKWLSDYEYEKLGLPKPDLVILLDLPEEIAERQLNSRYNGDDSKKDIHERDRDYMKTCRECALFAAEKEKWRVINCGENGNIKSIEQINAEIIKAIEGLFC
jgi:dTMP kinase